MRQRLFLSALLAAALAVGGVAQGQDDDFLSRTEYALAFGRLADVRNAALIAARSAAEEKLTEVQKAHAEAVEKGTDDAPSDQELTSARRAVKKDLAEEIEKIEASFYEDLLALRARQLDR